MNMRLLWVSQFTNTAGLMMLVPIMPLYMDTLGAPSASLGMWAGAAIAAPALPLALVTPAWGRLGDRVGQKWMVVRALVGLGLAMLLMALAATPLALVLARLVQGTFGGVVEAAAAFVGSESEGGRRGSALGRSYSATAAGALAGPLAGGLLVASGRLNWLLFGIAVSATILAVICSISLRSHAPRASATGKPHAEHSRRTGARETRRQIGWGALTAGFLVYLGSYGLIPVYAEYVADLVDDPADAGPWVGGLHAVMWSGTLVGALWWGRVNDRHGRPLGALAVAAVCAAVAVLVQALMPWLLVQVPLRFIQGVTFGALGQSLLLHASQRAPDRQRAGYVGTANSFLLMGQFLGPLLAGALVSGIAPAHATVATACAIALGATFAWKSAVTAHRSTCAPGRHRYRPRGPSHR